MAADYGKMAASLTRFYDFLDKTVLFVGAGRKQLLDPAIRTKKMIAIDQDADALKELEARVAAKGMQELVDVVAADFTDVSARGDVVYFEFCLHEMIDPLRALAHARSLAPDIVAYDHLPGSEWIFHGAEEEEVARGADAMKQFGIRRRETFVTEQRFKDHAELSAKVAGQGPVAIERAQHFAGVSPVVIPMRYALTLL
jgi:hypothetical protein